SGRGRPSLLRRDIYQPQQSGGQVGTGHLPAPGRDPRSEREWRLPAAARFAAGRWNVHATGARPALRHQQHQRRGPLNMSLLMDALRKAEEAKRAAGQSEATVAVETQSATESAPDSTLSAIQELGLEPLSA